MIWLQSVIHLTTASHQVSVFNRSSRPDETWNFCLGLAYGVQAKRQLASYRFTVRYIPVDLQLASLLRKHHKENAPGGIAVATGQEVWMDDLVTLEDDKRYSRSQKEAYEYDIAPYLAKLTSIWWLSLDYHDIISSSCSFLRRSWDPASRRAVCTLKKLATNKSSPEKVGDSILPSTSTPVAMFCLENLVRSRIYSLPLKFHP